MPTPEPARTPGATTKTITKIALSGLVLAVFLLTGSLTAKSQIQGLDHFSEPTTDPTNFELRQQAGAYQALLPEKEAAPAPTTADDEGADPTGKIALGVLAFFTALALVALIVTYRPWTRLVRPIKQLRQRKRSTTAKGGASPASGRRSLVRFLFVSPVIVGFALTAFLFFQQEPQTAEAGWWNDNWSYRKAITINSAKVAGDLTDFPVLVSLTDTNLGSHAQADGDDIVFLDSEGKKLSHEIESFSTTTGALVAWVKFPTLSGSQDANIYMYYGNGGVESQQDRENVWDENYMAVWHMPDDVTASGTDSTKNGMDGRAVYGASTTASAKIGGGMQFDGEQDYLNLHDNTYWDLQDEDEITVTAWIKLTGDISGTYGNLWGDAQGPCFQLHKYGASSYRMNWYTNGERTSDIVTINPGTWYYVTVTRTGETGGAGTGMNAWYLNGTNVGFLATLNEYDEDPSSVRIGSSEGSEWFWGVIDEMRVSSIRRSTSTIQTEYNNQSDPASFLSVQAEEVGPGPVGYWSFDEGYGSVANDASGNGNNGTVAGATWQDESMCVSGKCLYFDGSSNYISVDDNNDQFDGSSFTISLWAKGPDQSGGWNVLLAKENWDDSSGWFMNVNTLADPDKLIFYDGQNGRISIPDPFSDSLWHHIAVSVSGSSGVMYVDGINKGSTAVLTLDDNDENLNIGARHDNAGGGSQDYFKGFIDEVKIYHYARTADEIRQDYAAGLAGVSSKTGVSASFGSQSDKWLTDGLVGYWPMDESATTSGSADMSGNGRDGVYEGNASTTAGKFGNGFIGGGGSDNIDTTDSVIGVGEATVCAWIKPSASDDSFVGNVEFQMYTATNNSIRVTNNNRSGPNADSADNVWTADNWLHVCMSRLVNGATTIYVDGEQSGTAGQPTTISDPGSFDFAIGTRGRSAAWPFDGQIDEVRVYNRALSPREVKQLYQWAPGPVAWWKFDEMSGTTAYDSAASSSSLVGGYDGILGGDGVGSYIPHPKTTVFDHFLSLLKQAVEFA